MASLRFLTSLIWLVLCSCEYDTLEELPELIPEPSPVPEPPFVPDAPITPIKPQPVADYVLQVFNTTNHKPSGRSSASLGISYDGQTILMVGGGINNDEWVSDNWKFNVANQTWTPEPLGFNRTGACSAQALSPLDVMWIYGGKQNGVETGTLVAFHVTSKLASLNPNPPASVPTQNVACTAVRENTRFVVFGGNNCSNQLVFYDYILRSWAQIDAGAKIVPKGRIAASAANYNSSQVIIFGGGCGGVYFNDVWRFDLTSETWSQDEYAPGSAIVPGLMYHAATIVDSRMFVFNGRSQDMPGGQSAIYMYDLSQNTWHQIITQAYLSPRQKQAIVTWHNRIFYFAGELGTPSDTTFYNDIGQFVIEKDCLALPCETCRNTTGCVWCSSNPASFRCVAGAKDTQFVKATCKADVLNTECPNDKMPLWALSLMVVALPIVLAIIAFVILQLSSRKENPMRYEEIK